MLLLFFVSCSNVKEETIESEHIIDLDILEMEHIKKSSLFEKTKVTILETRDDVLFSYIDKLYVTEDHIFILDKTAANRVFLFDKNGKFIRKIGRSGVGPGEYNFVTDFTIDEENRVIYLLESGGKVNKYNFDNGDFLSSIRFENADLQGESIQYYDGKLWADIINLEADLLRSMDINSGKQINSYLKAADYCIEKTPVTYIPYSSPFVSNAKNSIKFVRHNFINTVFSIEKNVVKPFLTLKSKDFVTTEDLLNIEDTFLFSIHLSEKNKFYAIKTYLEFGHMILLSLNQGRYLLDYLYDTKTKTAQSITIWEDLVFSDVNNAVYCPLRFSDSKGIYEVVDGDYLSGFMDLLHEDGIVSDLDKKQELLELKEDANPIIFYYESKQ
jgi:hypothetical protein